jgi:hypothetical protein
MGYDAHLLYALAVVLFWIALFLGHLALAQSRDAKAQKAPRAAGHRLPPLGGNHNRGIACEVIPHPRSAALRGNAARLDRRRAEAAAVATSEIGGDAA